MTDDSHVEGHVFADSESAADYWTPERMAAARPREMNLDEDGTRLDQRTDGSDAETEAGSTDSTEP